MVFLLTKTPSIQVIFSKYPNGIYTKDALLYQDILRFSVKELEPQEECTFKLWELTEWLISNNLEIANYYKNPSASHMTKSNKIQARIGRVKRHLDILLYLGLIGEHSRTKESKGQGMTLVYSFTEFGLIIALLIMTTTPKKRQKALSFLYKTFSKNFQTNPSSLDAFALSFTEELYKNNLFDKYIDTLLETVQKKISIQDANEFFSKPLILDLNKEDSELFQKLKREAFDDLSPENKKYFMHKQKLDIEARMFGISNNLKSFEELVFRIKKDYEKVATEGFCENCKLYFAIGLSLIEYLNQSHFTEHQTVKCPNCEIENSIKIPSFRD